LAGWQVTINSTAIYKVLSKTNKQAKKEVDGYSAAVVVRLWYAATAVGAWRCARRGSA
jgi:hypothetical protein